MRKSIYADTTCVVSIRAVMVGPNELDKAIPVTAWVPHRVVYDEAQLIDAEAIAWTEGARADPLDAGTHCAPEPSLGLRGRRPTSAE